MNKYEKPRLRHFESAPGQRHISDDDKYLYERDTPRHNINIIGTGTIGQEHMRVAHLLGRARVHGIYDTSELSMEVARENYSTYCDDALVDYQSLDDACNDPNANALMICTPNYSHLDVLETACRSGKPVFLEKPMATTVGDAKRIVELAAGYASFIQVGLQYRFKAAYVEARSEVFERCSLGDIKTISMSEYRPPFLDKVAQWNKFEAYSGGTLVEKCCHYFDLMNLFARSTPSVVYASGGQAVNFLDFERDGKTADIHDHAFVVIDYENGIRGQFTLNMFSPHFHEQLVLSGSEGRLVAEERFDFLNSDVAESSVSIERGEDAASRHSAVGYARAIEQSGHHGATYFEHVAFIDRLEGGTSDAATPMQGLWSVIVAVAAHQSAASNQAVSVADFLAENGLTELPNPWTGKQL